ncbi:MAG: hypothetical protein Q9165_007282 [Trypethelium subeluteriae]
MNTLPALTAGIRNSDSEAFWIDALCVPTAQPERRITLESMGFIYSRAKEVRAALSNDSFKAMRQLAINKELNVAGMATLEQDKWIQSVWTYQEVVNSQLLVFVCHDAPGMLVDSDDFLNGLGYSLSKYKERHGIDALSMREHFPALDAFDDLIADRMIAGYTERSALAVMSNMDRRKWDDENNYFFAMIGAISDKIYRWTSEHDKPPSESFMMICEAKNDFSFIFSSTARSTDPARRWRPSSGPLPSILPWHSWGESQPGEVNLDGSLQLDSMMELRRSSLSKDAKRFLQWLRREDLSEASEVTIPEKIYMSLLRMGFTGRKEYISLSHGLFYPQDEVLPQADVKILVSTSIRWTLGAPGLANIFAGMNSYIPGVFVGLIDPKIARSVRLA